LIAFCIEEFMVESIFYFNGKFRISYCISLFAQQCSRFF
jgi:hypothetical protein